MKSAHWATRLILCYFLTVRHLHQSVKLLRQNELAVVLTVALQQHHSGEDVGLSWSVMLVRCMKSYMEYPVPHTCPKITQFEGAIEEEVVIASNIKS